MTAQVQQLSEEQRLETILCERGLGWAINVFAPSSNAAAHYLAALNALESYIEDQRLGTASFSPESLEQLVDVSPYKADAFLQALVSIRSTSILCAAWRILQGMEIELMETTYSRLTKFELRITLRSPNGSTEQYESSDVNDIAFVRHLGKSTIGEKPYLDGFYPLRQT